MDGRLKRGTIVLAIYPFTDLSSTKRRPALVVSATERADTDCILAFITSHVEKNDVTDLVLDVRDADFTTTGLSMASAIRCGKLMTLDRSLLTGRLGQLSERLMSQVNLKLRKALDLL